MFISLYEYRITKKSEFLLYKYLIVCDLYNTRQHVKCAFQAICFKRTEDQEILTFHFRFFWASVASTTRNKESRSRTVFMFNR